MKKVIVLFVCIVASQVANAQEGFGTSTPDPSSVIDMVASDKGALLPRVTLQDLTDIATVLNPANGLTVFNVPDPLNPFYTLPEGYHYWSAEKAQWVQLLNDYTGWGLKGNAGTLPAGGTGPGTDFLGTTDDTDFQIRVGATPNEVMRAKGTSGHVQFGNWLDVSSSPNLPNPDAYTFITGSIISSPSNFSIANNFSSITGSTSNFRTLANVNTSSSSSFFGNNMVTNFFNGYTGPIAGNAVSVNFGGNGTYTTTGVNLILSNHSTINVTSGSSATSAGGTGSILGTFSNLGSVTGPSFVIKGRTSGSPVGTFSGAFTGLQGSLESTNTYNSTATAVQGSISQGNFNGTVTGVEASITGGTLNGNAIGLRSNVTANSANGYGLYIEDVAGTTQHGIYQAGTNDNNYFGGNTKIGTTGVASNKLHVAAASNPVRFEGLQTTAATGESVLVTDATGVIKTIAQSAVAANNIYNVNGTLTENRTVTMGTNSLSFANGSNRFNLNHTATDANASLLATNRANMRIGAGSGVTASNLDIFQDVSAVGQIAVNGASTGLQIGSANGSTAPVHLMTNGTNRVTVLANGDVGVGAPAPSNKLHVTSTADPIRLEGLQTGNTSSDQLLAVTSTGVVKQVGTLPVSSLSSLPAPAVFSLTNNFTNFLNGVAAGSSQTLPMTMTKNAITGLTYNSGTSTITFPAGLYQMTMVYEGEHNATSCTLSSYLVDFPVGAGSTVERIHSTAAHNQGGASNHGGSIIYTAQIPAGRTWTIQMGRGQSGNCTGTGNSLAQKRTQFIVYRLGD